MASVDEFFRVSVEGIPQRETAVTFVAHFASYFPGEVAAFTPEEAQELADRGVIEVAPPPTPTAAFLTGGTVADPATLLTALEAVADGSFRIAINTVVQNTTQTDFAGSNNLALVAALITSSLGGNTVARCTWNAVGSRFTITTAATGTAATIGYASAPPSGTDISDACALSQASGATLTQGTAG
jgi:hypothetical protein